MKAGGTVRQDQIVEAAIRRFSHFGISKTTLTELAEDLAVSKQALSYYFHDKQSLVKTVLERISTDYENRLKEEMEKTGTVEAALLKLTEVRSAFFRKYFMLVMQTDHPELAPKQMAFNRQQIHETELELVTTLLEKGAGQGELRPLDARKTAMLLLETLHAFSRCVKNRGALPDAGAFADVFEKQQQVTRLFYQGLKSEAWPR